MGKTFNIMWSTSVNGLPEIEIDGEPTDILHCIEILFAEIQRLEDLIQEDKGK